jgi:serine/threonine protein phosphatase PrpC
VKSGQLVGRDHLEIGAAASLHDGVAAISLSRGGAPKRYAHADPNEDAAGYAIGTYGVLAVVADGHAGSEASEIAVGRVLDGFAARWTEESLLETRDWMREAVACVVDANDAVVSARGDGRARRARTTLAFAVTRPAEGLLLYASIGDSHVFRATPDGAVDLTWGRAPAGGPFFLGYAEETADELQQKCRIAVEQLQGTRAVVLATDGLSEESVGVADPEGAVADATRRAVAEPRELRALRLAQTLTAAALEAQRSNDAGDNVATAVIFADAPHA